MPYPTLSSDLQEKVDSVALSYEPAIQAGKYEGAFEAYEELYKLLLTKQPLGGRYHKGYPLHNMGYILLLQGKQNEALHYFTLAYVEDLLSENKGEEDKADQTPAGRALLQAYLIKEELLRRLKRIVQEKKERSCVVSDPEKVLKELAQLKDPQTFVASMAEAQPEVPKVKRQPGNFEKGWHERVFVGGSYKEIAIINRIKKHIASKGYEPVVASDFETPPDLIHHHSLMLLHACKYAIFDLSQEAGQLMEIERVRDYEVGTMAVYQAIQGQPPRITEMLKSALKSRDIPLKSYEDTEKELRAHIDSFLPNLD